MRAMSEAALSALTGSRSGERLICHIWYDGAVVAPDVDISDWRIESDGSRQVRTRVSLTATDPDGMLAPWGVDDPLGVGGARAQLIYALTATETVDLGWYRITTSDPAENWTLRRITDPATGEEKSQVWVSGGAQIPVGADDLTALAVADRLLAAESPGAGSTVLSEVRRLLSGIMPVTVAAEVTDRAVATSTVFERERMDAVEDLLAMISCTHRMTGDGQLEVYPTAPGTPVWEVAGGDDGVMVSLRRSQSADGLYNAAVSEGATPDGRQLIGRAFETTGPLRWEGPHWRRPVFHAATGILTTQAAVDADATSILAGSLRGRTVDLSITCLPHPGLQSGDVVTVASPTVTGAAIALTGVVRKTGLRGSAAGVSPMTMTVECAYEDVQTVAAAIRRAT